MLYRPREALLECAADAILSSILRDMIDMTSQGNPEQLVNGFSHT